MPGKSIVLSVPLIKPEILLLPLHIKLGLMKNFLNALPKDGRAMEFLVAFFPGVSTAKREDGVFVGPDIRKAHAEFGI